MDTNYPVEGDSFYNANVVFQRIVPNIWYLIGGGILLAVLWLLVGIYLTVTAGVAYDEEDEPVLYLNGIDHVWIEFMALLLVGFIYGGRIGYDYLMNVANKVYLSHSEIQGREITRLHSLWCLCAVWLLRKHGNQCFLVQPDPQDQIPQYVE